MEKHDIIIIGGGPSGSVLAHYLANFGLDAVVIEKGDHFRDKTCAGGLPKGIFDILPQEIKNSFPFTPYLKFNVFFDSKLSATTQFSKPFAFGVMRKDFDESLRNGINVKYKERFIKFEESNNGIYVKTDKNEYFGKYLVGADGIGSSVALQANLCKKTKIVIAEEKEIEKKDFDGSLNVYLWSFSLGYGWKFDKQSVSSVGAGALKRFYKKGMSNRVDKSEAKLKYYPISLWDGQRDLFKGRVVLVGEAASIVDPFNAAGIYHSILSSILLAKVIKENLDRGYSSFDNYINTLEATIFEEFRYASILASAFYPLLPILKNVVLRKSILDFIVSVQDRFGYLSYKEIFNRFEKSKHFEVKIALFVLKLLRIV